MNKRKQDTAKPGRATARITDRNVIEVGFHGHITGPIVTQLLDDITALAQTLRAQHHPVLILTDISGIASHDSAARVAVKQAFRIPFDRGAAYGGTTAMGLLMQYLQRSISAHRAQYFRDRTSAVRWLTSTKPLKHTLHRPSWLMIAIMFGSLAGVIALSYLSWTSNRTRIGHDAQTAFDHQADIIETTLEQRMRVYISALYGFRGLYNASDEVTLTDFDNYFKSLNLQSDYPGFNGISYISRVRANEKARFETKNHYTITPAANKAEYYPITYVEPITTSTSLGFDLGTSPERVQTFNTARDSGDYAASDSLNLIGSNQRGFIISLPIYGHSTPPTVEQRRTQLTGFINAIFNYQTLFSDAFSKSQLDVYLQVKDDDGQNLYQSGTPITATNRLTESREFKVAGETFILDFAAPANYGLTLVAQRQPSTVLASGIIVSLLLLSVMITSLRSRRRAIKLANAMTEDLEQERNLAITNQHKLEQAEAALRQEKTSVERKVIERTHQLSEAHAQLTASIKSLPFGFAIIDPHNQILVANAQLTKLTRLKFPADLGDQPTTADKLSQRYQHQLDLKTTLTQVQTTLKGFEQVIEHGPNFYRFTIVPITVTANDPAIGAALIMQDITEEKVLQRSRDEFFSIASHELRTPLTAIRGNLSIILDTEPDKLTGPAVHDMVSDAHEASLRLISIVTDFLDMSSLEQGKVIFKTSAVDLVTLAHQTTREFESIAAAKSIKLHVAASSAKQLALADPNRLHQIITSLMDNAIKYTETGNITLSISATKQTAKLAIIDTGSGIPESSQHLLFRKFQQASENILTRDSSRSTGLGLYIGRLLAQGMNGRLVLDHSRVGQGSSFVIELPLATNTSHPQNTTATPTVPAPPDETTP